MRSNSGKGCGCWLFSIAIILTIVFSIIGGNKPGSKDSEVAASSAPAAAPAASSATAIPASVLSPLTPKNTSALSDAIAWAKTEYSSIDWKMNAAAGEIDPSLYSSDFKFANDLYKAGNFDAAQNAYEVVLSQCPVHLGARNNYVLALAYCGEYENSLKNSILLGLIHPEYAGNWVNILIPLYALGYDDSSYSSSLINAGFPDDSLLESMMKNRTFPSYYTQAYAYNRVYADMEAAYSEEELKASMEKFESILQALKDTSPSDTDYSELFEYLEGLAKLKTK